MSDSTGNSVLTAFKDILDTLKPPFGQPQVFDCDRGVVYTNKKFRLFAKSRNIRISYARMSNKSRLAERHIRSCKKVLILYLQQNPNVAWEDALRNVAENLNMRYNRDLQMSPVETFTKWRELQNLYRDQQKRVSFNDYVNSQNKLNSGKKVKDGRKMFFIGQKVYIPFKEEKMSKESDRNFTFQIYKVKQILNEEKPFLYKLEDIKGNILKRLYYASELKVAFTPEYYPIEKVISSKKVGNRKYYKIRWMDHDKTFDSWISASEFRKSSGKGKKETS